MMMNTIRKFTRAEKGAMSLEAVLAIPMLVWALTATFVFFDAFKTLNISQKATYTVADMLSREENKIDADYLTALHEVYDLLAESNGDNALRVSVVRMDAGSIPDEGVLALEFSEAIGGIEGHANIDPLKDRIPEMGVGDYLIVVESEQEWAPSFAVGLTAYRFREVAIARPRFGPKLGWDDGSA